MNSEVSRLDISSSRYVYLFVYTSICLPARPSIHHSPWPPPVACTRDNREEDIRREREKTSPNTLARSTQREKI